MNKTAIKNFSIWARNKLIADIRYRAGLLGIRPDGILAPLPQSTGDTEFYDIGTAEPYSVSGEAVRQRRKLVDAIRRKERESGYEAAYRYIVEEAAYTWFNRLIAVRFMEVNDYLPSHVRVLSSDSGKLEPDLVTSPFDAELPFTPEEKQTVTQLKQDNRIDELFRLLFIKQCNALNEILPGLFERTDDYTELLLSVSVVDRDGVVYHLTHDIDEDDFNVEKGGQVEIIGWLYQYYNTEPKNAVFGRPSGVKIRKEEIPAATQLFTPDWIVRYMVENSLGRLWVEGHPNEELKANWKYYLEEAEQEPAVQARLDDIRKEYAALSPEDIKCIDPCMGSGHILCYLFDVLMQIYESQGYSRRDAVQNILRHNLYGLDIDKRAAQLAYFSVMMKARQYDRRFFSRNLQPRVYSTAWDEDGENFGSLVTVEDPGEMPEDPRSIFEMPDYERRLNVWNYRYLLAQKYHVVVTNPPYMGASNMNGALSDFIKKNYADYKSDYFSAFFVRCSQMALPTGKLGFFSPYVWMFIQSYEKLRQLFCQQKTIETLIQFEYSAFEEATVPVCTFVYSNYHVNKRGCYFRLTDFRGGMEVQRQKTLEAIANHDCGYYYEQSADNFSKIPGSPVAYWVSEQVLSCFRTMPSLGGKYTLLAGTSTGDNNRYQRNWFEVSSGSISRNHEAHRWFPCNTGGEFHKYSLNCVCVIDWENDGFRIKNHVNGKGKIGSAVRNRSFFFKEGITWNKLSSANFGVRYVPPGYISDDTARMIVAKSGENLFCLLGFLCSNVCKYFLSILSPTMSFTNSELQRIPLLTEVGNSPAGLLAEQNYQLSVMDRDSFETSWDFQYHPIVRKAMSRSHWNADGDETIEYVYKYVAQDFESRFQQLKANEEELNRIFIRLYGLQDELTPEVEAKDVTVRRADLGRDVRSLLSYAVGCMFGRYSLDEPGLAYAGGEWDASKYRTFLPDADGILPITDEEYFDDDIVGLLCAWLKKVFGPGTLEENLDFIAGALGGRGNTSREVIRNYFLKDFFTDHCRIYQKRPIYWLFDSGKQNGFKALIYLHRYTPDTVGNLRIDYLHRMQRIYESEIGRMQDMAEHSGSPREAAAAAKRGEKLRKQLKECREYDEKVGHLALSRIELDLDDGVKVNYRKMQTASDGRFYEVLADSKNIIGKK